MYIRLYVGFPSGSAVKKSPAMQATWETQGQSLDWEDPLEKKVATHSSILVWKPHGQRNVVGCSP